MGGQIRLGGKIALRRLPQRLGKRLRLHGREMPLVAQRAGTAEGVEENGGHTANMERDRQIAYEPRLGASAAGSYCLPLKRSLTAKTFCISAGGG